MSKETEEVVKEQTEGSADSERRTSSCSETGGEDVGKRTVLLTL